MGNLSPNKIAVPKGAIFHNLGLDGAVNPATKMSTLDNIRKQLGHTNKTIDILKVDIEYSEWEAIPQMIESGSLKTVKQFIVEIHFLKKTKDQKIGYLKTLQQLHDYGFLKFNRDKNLGYIAYLPKSKDYVYFFTELSYINTRYLGYEPHN